MKALVVFFSKTGNTRRLAGEIAAQLKADSGEITEEKNRGGVIAFMKSGWEGTRRKTVKINDSKIDPSSYGLVLIGTPVWAGNMCSPVRSYLERHKGQFKKVAFFCTCSSEPNKTFPDMEKIAGKPAATIAVIDKEVKGSSYKEKAKDFAKKLAK